LLLIRVQSVVFAEVPAFADVIRIYNIKQRVNDLNHARMRDFNRPVYVFEVIYEGYKASEASLLKAGNLYMSFLFTINCRIMLLKNIWTKRNLVNGSLGTVRNIVWASEKDIKKDLLFALLVYFGNYQGPFLITTGNGLLLLPIFRSRRKFYRGAINCSRTQFFITIAYAITVHKTQGMTV
jgi:hypothetical protein